MNPLDQAWMEFVNRREDSMIFHHPAWIQLIADSYGYRPFVVGVREGNGRYHAGIPVMEINSPITGRRWVSLPFSDFCSPLSETENRLEQVVEDVLSLARAKGIRNVELRGTFSPHPALVTDSDCVFHELDLEPNHENVFARLHEMHRRNIKTARQKGVRIVRGDSYEHLKEFYNMHLLTRRRQGVPVQPWKFFRGLGRLFEQGLGFLLLAYVEQRCVAGAVFLHWQKTLTYKYGASLPDDLQARPNNLIMWTAIQWGCDNGFDVMDFGKTDLANTGLRTFKSRWGARELPLSYTYLAPHKKRIGDGKLKILLSEIIQRSPPQVGRVLGELLYKHFG
jgi:CelD/BcsL family acetyltransferase involved in cellulose biosynthesis